MRCERCNEIGRISTRVRNLEDSLSKKKSDDEFEKVLAAIKTLADKEQVLVAKPCTCTVEENKTR